MTVPFSGMLAASGNFPILNAQSMRGNVHYAADITARNAIPGAALSPTADTQFRAQGMLVYVASEAKTYQLQGGITNAHWVEFGEPAVGGGGGGGGHTFDFIEVGTGSGSYPGMGVIRLKEDSLAPEFDPWVDASLIVVRDQTDVDVTLLHYNSSGGFPFFELGDLGFHTVSVAGARTLLSASNQLSLYGGNEVGIDSSGRMEITAVDEFELWNEGTALWDQTGAVEFYFYSTLLWNNQGAAEFDFDSTVLWRSTSMTFRPVGNFSVFGTGSSAIDLECTTFIYVGTTGGYMQFASHGDIYIASTIGIMSIDIDDYVEIISGAEIDLDAVGDITFTPGASFSTRINRLDLLGTTAGTAGVLTAYATIKANGTQYKLPLHALA